MKPNNDELMDQLLKKTMAGEAPRLSASFDAEVMRRAKPRSLSATGRVVIAVYAIVATAVAAWFMRDLPAAWIAAGFAISLAVGAGTGFYGRHIVQRTR